MIVTVTVQSELNFADFRTGGVRPIEQKTQGTRKKKTQSKRCGAYMLGTWQSQKGTTPQTEIKTAMKGFFLNEKEQRTEEQ